MNEKLEKSYFFNEIDDLIKYLFAKYGKLSPLKLQKGLYFLFAYYGGTYGNSGKFEAEIDYKLPEFLFPAQFLAWDYGPVIEEVYYKNKNEDYDCHVNSPSTLSEINEAYFNENNTNHEVKLFIDELFDEVISTSDFSLVDRSHEDKAWKNAYGKGRNIEMPINEIVEEYLTNNVR
ncbi:hypothetical protein AST07_01320 [Staphylococcus saprophyticus]|uniref:Panacea domain-containing protein n=1 Tax=Staphylococcus saprophyticus TaxID=29385 RepID=UPI000853AE8C|nr:type II toxin-antitoxin system antitoxin SocA domain-containing protein [Staphylococcus saprophyticus]MDW4319777.1 DUF4065 domain-containing protein [Staphylococcus saprophyticus]OEK72710.1 hypothetical protein AST06_11805 [Staphylococcus saprophyticus]OEK93287.1 hypothetical protein AST07_01320 [Staphylococcus saprophyticus]